jgi:hypothetical protein
VRKIHAAFADEKLYMLDSLVSGGPSGVGVGSMAKLVHNCTGCRFWGWRSPIARSPAASTHFVAGIGRRTQ